MEYNTVHLKELEDESIFVLREAAAQFERRVILFSGGKDSTVLVHLARQAFSPGTIPFNLLHVDTGHNFDEVILFRDKVASEFNVKCFVAKVQDTIDNGRAIDETGYYASRNKIQSITLMDFIRDFKADVLIGGARRDEEKSRAKERFFSHRNEFGQWDPKNQRPELWNVFNGNKHYGEHFRVFPLSNWTELDVWYYILKHKVELPSIYFTHKRQIFERDGVLLPWSKYINVKPTEKPIYGDVRCRTVGDMTCTGLTLSTAKTVEEVIQEIIECKTSERGGRFDDTRSDTSMEDRKKEGYF